jgi:trk system potassium uptake protein TrkA
MIIAATHSDEVNMVCCQIAQSPSSTSPARSPASGRRTIWIPAIPMLQPRPAGHRRGDQPRARGGRGGLQRLAAPATFDTEVFMGGRAQLLGIQLAEDCPVLNTPLRQLNELFSTLRAIVVGVRRDGRLFAPDPGDQLAAEDQIYVFTHVEDVNRTLEIFGKKTKKQERVIIIGGGNVGLTVARALETRSDRTRAKIIEKNRATAERAADTLERTIVLNGDGMDMDLLMEASIDRADAVLAVTDDDKTNLLAAVRAKQAGCRMAIALVNDPTLRR